jgi:tetratricopeptide (TPR) repeat protein
MTKRKSLLTFLSVTVFLFSAASAVSLTPEEEEARKDYEMLGDESKILLKEARAYRFLDAMEHGLRQYEELIRRYPQHARLLKETGDVYAEIHNFEKAKELYDKALVLKPYDKTFRLAWPVALGSNGRPEESVKALREIIHEDPHFLEAHQALVQTLLVQKKWKEAFDEQQKVIERKPGDFDELLKRARIVSWSEDWKGAIGYYEELLVSYPDNKDVLKELGQLYAWTQNWQKARVTFEKLLVLYPNDDEALKELGNVYFFDEKYDAARRIYQRLGQSDPDLARQLTARLNEGAYIDAPTLSYYFLYYGEWDRRAKVKSRSYYHTAEYRHPVESWWSWLFSTTVRQSPKLEFTSVIYNAVIQMKIFKNVWYSLQGGIEPENFELNPRWNVRNAISWRVQDRWDVNVYSHYTEYWNRNRSHSAGVGFSHFLLKDRSLVFTYRLSHDVAEEPSDFFVVIDDEEDHTLDVFTHTFNVEKYWRLPREWFVTTGGTYYFNSDERRGWVGYGNLSLPLTRNLRVVFGGSRGRDDHGVENFSISGYASYRF